MEAYAALVGADGVAELHAVSQIDMHLSVVIHPGYAEGDDAVGLHQTLYQSRTLKLRVLVVNALDGEQHFLDGLQVLGLTGMLGLQLL